MKLAGSLFLIAMGVLACWVGFSPIDLHTKALAHEAINLPVDLSVRTEYQASFNQLYRATHGKQFRFEMEPQFGSTEEMYAAMRDFKGTLVVTLRSGKTVLKEDLDLQSFQEDHSPGCRWHAPLNPLTPYAFIPSFDTMGEPCRLSLIVTSPAADLGHRRQRLVSKNVLCRTESIGDYLGGAIIFIGVSLFFGGIYVFRSFLRRGNRQNN